MPPPLLGHGTAVEIPNADLLGLTPQMQAFLERYVLEYRDLDVRRQLLALSVSSSSIMGFHYNVDRTLTSTEAFETRSGNCLAFANMFVALARAAGLKARYHEVLIEPEWFSLEDTFIISRHINVVIDSPAGIFEHDISGRDIQATAFRRIMKDFEAAAMFYNNLGVEALFEGDLASAHAYIVKAIETAPEHSDAWSNLGVILGRNDQMEEAEFAYHTALRLNGKERTALGNLYELYLVQERFDEAASLKTRVDKYRQNNPYYLLYLSDEAIAKQQYQESFKLLSRAIRKKENEHLLHFAMARTQYLSGTSRCRTIQSRSCKRVGAQERSVRLQPIVTRTHSPERGKQAAIRNRSGLVDFKLLQLTLQVVRAALPFHRT